MEKIHTWLSLLLAVTMPTTAMAAYTAPFSFTPTQAQFNECVVEDGGMVKNMCLGVKIT